MNSVEENYTSERSCDDFSASSYFDNHESSDKYRISVNGDKEKSALLKAGISGRFASANKTPSSFARLLQNAGKKEPNLKQKAKQLRSKALATKVFEIRRKNENPGYQSSSKLPHTISRHFNRGTATSKFVEKATSRISARKLNEKKVKSGAALNVQRVFRGHQHRKKYEFIRAIWDDESVSTINDNQLEENEKDYENKIKIISQLPQRMFEDESIRSSGNHHGESFLSASSWENADISQRPKSADFQRYRMDRLSETLDLEKKIDHLNDKISRLQQLKLPYSISDGYKDTLPGNHEEYNIRKNLINHFSDTSAGMPHQRKEHFQRKVSSNAWTPNDKYALLKRKQRLAEKEKEIILREQALNDYLHQLERETLKNNKRNVILEARINKAKKDNNRYKHGKSERKHKPRHETRSKKKGIVTKTSNKSNKTELKSLFSTDKSPKTKNRQNGETTSNKHKRTSAAIIIQSMIRGYIVRLSLISKRNGKKKKDSSKKPSHRMKAIESRTRKQSDSRIDKAIEKESIDSLLHLSSDHSGEFDLSDNRMKDENKGIQLDQHNKIEIETPLSQSSARSISSRSISSSIRSESSIRQTLPELKQMVRQLNKYDFTLGRSKVKPEFIEKVPKVVFKEQLESQIRFFQEEKASLLIQTAYRNNHRKSKHVEQHNNNTNDTFESTQDRAHIIVSELPNDSTTKILENPIDEDKCLNEDDLTCETKFENIQESTSPKLQSQWQQSEYTVHDIGNSECLEEPDGIQKGTLAHYDYSTGEHQLYEYPDGNDLNALPVPKQTVFNGYTIDEAQMEPSDGLSKYDDPLITYEYENENTNNDYLPQEALETCNWETQEEYYTENGRIKSDIDIISDEAETGEIVATTDIVQPATYQEHGTTEDESNIHSIEYNGEVTTEVVDGIVLENQQYHEDMNNYDAIDTSENKTVHTENGSTTPNATDQCSTYNTTKQQKENDACFADGIEGYKDVKKNDTSNQVNGIATEVYTNDNDVFPAQTDAYENTYGTFETTMESDMDFTETNVQNNHDQANAYENAYGAFEQTAEIAKDITETKEQNNNDFLEHENYQNKGNYPFESYDATNTDNVQNNPEDFEYTRNPVKESGDLSKTENVQLNEEADEYPIYPVEESYEPSNVHNTQDFTEGGDYAEYSGEKYHNLYELDNVQNNTKDDEFTNNSISNVYNTQDNLEGGKYTEYPVEKDHYPSSFDNAQNNANNGEITDNHADESHKLSHIATDKTEDAEYTNGPVEESYEPCNLNTVQDNTDNGENIGAYDQLSWKHSLSENKQNHDIPEEAEERSSHVYDLETEIQAENKGKAKQCVDGGEIEKPTGENENQPNMNRCTETVNNEQSDNNLTDKKTNQENDNFYFDANVEDEDILVPHEETMEIENTDTNQQYEEEKYIHENNINGNNEETRHGAEIEKPLDMDIISSEQSPENWRNYIEEPNDPLPQVPPTDLPKENVLSSGWQPYTYDNGNVYYYPESESQGYYNNTESYDGVAKDEYYNYQASTPKIPEGSDVGYYPENENEIQVYYNNVEANDEAAREEYYNDQPNSPKSPKRSIAVKQTMEAMKQSGFVCADTVDLKKYASHRVKLIRSNGSIDEVILVEPVGENKVRCRKESGKSFVKKTIYCWVIPPDILDLANQDEVKSEENNNEKPNNNDNNEILYSNEYEYKEHENHQGLYQNEYEEVQVPESSPSNAESQNHATLNEYPSDNHNDENIEVNPAENVKGIYGDWEVCEDDNGAEFYYNTITCESRWTEPEELHDTLQERDEDEFYGNAQILVKKKKTKSRSVFDRPKSPILQPDVFDTPNSPKNNNSPTNNQAVEAAMF